MIRENVVEDELATRAIFLSGLKREVVNVIELHQHEPWWTYAMRL